MVDSKSVSDEKLGLKNNDDILKDFGVSPLRKSTGGYKSPAIKHISFSEEDEA